MISRFVIFGDSLLDKNNFCRISKFNSKVCPDGFFSNGPTAPYYLRDILETKYEKKISIENYAIGGALISDSNPARQFTKYSFPISKQIKAYAKKKSFSNNDLVIINGGCNNLFTILVGDFPYLHPKLPFKVTKDYFSQIEKLIELGAKNILYSTLPDITLAPFFNLKISKDKLIVKLLKKFFRHRVIQINKSIKVNHIKLKSKFEDCNISLFDSFDFMRLLFENADEYGFTNINSACIHSLGGFDIKGQKQLDESLSIEHDPESSFFWDLVHPTTKVYKLVARNWATLI